MMRRATDHSLVDSHARVAKVRVLAFLLAALSLLLGSAVRAQNSMSWSEQYARVVSAARTIAPLSDSGFGDNVNLYDGATTFTATDISLPGNSDLPVELTRTWDLQNDGTSQQTIGDWVIDVPNLNGVFLPGGWPNARCSQASTPPSVQVGYSIVKPYNYWGGYRLSLPGAQSAMMLSKTSDQKLQKPAESVGATSPWTTKDGWFFGCLPGIQNGGGEGFVGFSPDGRKYSFDWMVIDNQRPIYAKALAPYSYYLINRVLVRIYATKVEDRFGNWVRYEWSGDRLQRIYANDGREIALFYDASGRLSIASASERSWVYQYAPFSTPQVDTHYLSQVLLPDGSRWRYDAS